MLLFCFFWLLCVVLTYPAHLAEVKSRGFSNSTWHDFDWVFSVLAGVWTKIWCLIAALDFIWQPFALWDIFKLSYYCNSSLKQSRWSQEAIFNCCSCDMCNCLNTLVFHKIDARWCNVFSYQRDTHGLTQTHLIPVLATHFPVLPHSTGTFFLPHKKKKKLKIVKLIIKYSWHACDTFALT